MRYRLLSPEEKPKEGDQVFNASIRGWNPWIPGLSYDSACPIRRKMVEYSAPIEENVLRELMSTVLFPLMGDLSLYLDLPDHRRSQLQRQLAKLISDLEN